jgi:pimeloyl-ACP methyl ester carboxylesterase
MAARFRAMFCNDMTAEQTADFLGKLGKDMWPMSTYAYSAWRYDHLDAVPATFVVCLQDMSLPPPWQEKFADQLRCGRRVYIDAGHQVMNTRPQALAEVLLAEAAI